MTIYRRLNQAGQGGHYTTWWLIKTMLDAGWTVPFSGSGTGGLYDSSNVFDLAQSPKYYTILDPNGVGIGSEPWGHRSCWICLEDPGGNRQMVLQRSVNSGNFYDGTWTLYWSPDGRFGEGQTAGVDWDEDTAVNAPDRAAEVSTAIFNNNAAASLAHIAVDDTPSPEGEYGVFCVELASVNTVRGVIMLDDLRNAPVGDPHPITVFGAGSGVFGSAFFGTSGADCPGTVVDYGTSAQRYVYNCSYCDYWGYSQTALPNNGGTGVDGKERAAPIVVVAPSSAPLSYLGISRWVKAPSVVRGYPDTASGEIYLYLNSVLVVDLLDGLTTPGTV